MLSTSLAIHSMYYKENCKTIVRWKIKSLSMHSFNLFYKNFISDISGQLQHKSMLCHKTILQSLQYKILLPYCTYIHN